MKPWHACCFSFKVQTKRQVVCETLKTFTSGSGQQPHFWAAAMKQQVVSWGQLVWASHFLLPSTSPFSVSTSSIHSSLSSGSICSASAVLVTWLWVVVATVVGAAVTNTGVFSFMGAEPEVLWQVRVARWQVVPDGQQCSWSSQQTALDTKWHLQYQTSSESCISESASEENTAIF